LLFDDILSALDIYTGKYILEETLLKYSNGKTIILVTHALQYLRHADYVYVIDGGRFIAQGSFSEVQNNELYKRFTEMELESKEKSEEVGHNEIGDIKKNFINTPDLSSPKEPAIDSLLEEDNKKGTASADDLKTFIKEIGGIKHFVVISLVAGIEILIYLYSIKILQGWSESTRSEGVYTIYTRYVFLTFIYCFGQPFRNGYFGMAAFYFIRSIHSKMVYRILHSKLQEFIDRTPIARILTIFSKDLHNLEERIYIDVSYMISYGLKILILIVFSIYSLGWIFAIGVFIYFYLIMKFQDLYVTTIRELKRFINIAHTPILSVFSDTLSGLPDVRNMKFQRYLKNKLYAAADEKSELWLLETISRRWFVFYSELFSICLISIPMNLLLLFQADQHLINIGIVLSTIKDIVSSFSTFLRNRSEFEMILINTERCNYLKELDPEEGYHTFKEEFKLAAKADNESLETLRKLDLERTKSASMFPNGLVSLQNVSARYITSNMRVLRNITFSVEAGSKIGVLGRTGSGKSSLIKLFYQYLKLEEGELIIDGFNLKAIDLKKLRNSLAVITQDSYLFQGTLRENLDPLGLHSDEEITSLLETAGFPLKLSFKLNMNGQNLSQGERQLITLIRAVLKGCKVIIFDEATASIDIKTEEILHSIIKTKLKNSTMIIIAHRLQSVDMCSKIILLENGSVKCITDPSKAKELLDSN